MDVNNKFFASEDEINLANKDIAKFMGWEEGRYPHLPNRLHRGHTRNGLEESIAIQELKYHESWDWLMPVVEELCRTRLYWSKDKKDDAYSYPRTFGMSVLEGPNLMVRFNGGSLYESYTLFEATYWAVVESVRWHNTAVQNNINQ